MRLGGLFSGIGGFELAWTQLGHEVAWMCEVDPKARKVLEVRFPGVRIYEDVREMDPTEVEPVDVLTGGSPCQGFSVAGRREGLLHGESRLFADYVRILDGLVPRGLRYAVWENVPGVLSIKNDDGERTFPHVIAALAGAAEPVRLDPKRRWTSGLVSAAGRGVAYRVLDSRYFGVAQRRRRIFACVAVGDSGPDRAGRALLAVAESVRRDSAARVAQEQAAAGGARAVAGSSGGGESGAGGPRRAGVAETTGPLTTGGVASARGSETTDSGFVVPDDPKTYAKYQHDEYRESEVGGTLTANMDRDAKVLIPGVFRKVRHDDYRSDEVGSTVTADAGNGPKDLVAESFNWQQGHAEYTLRDDASALAADSRPAVLLTMRDGKPGGGKGPLLSEEQSLTLATGNGQTLFDPTADGARAFRKSKRPNSKDDYESWVEDGQANTLNLFDVGDKRTTHAVVEPVAFSVREDAKAGNFSATEVGVSGALQATQASPSSHHAQTYVAETVDGVSYDGLNQKVEVGVHRSLRTGRDSSDFVVQPEATYGVRRLTPVECERLQAFPDGWTEPAGSDAARYRALGNAVTVNTVRWILARIVDTEEGR